MNKDLIYKLVEYYKIKKYLPLKKKENILEKEWEKMREEVDKVLLQKISENFPEILKTNKEIYLDIYNK